jgi:hypothetical protein
VVKQFEYIGTNNDPFPSYSYQNNNANPKRPFEKHHTPAEVAEIGGISVDMARDLFRGEEDVLKLERTGSKKYVTLRIPESVLLRVHTRMSRA